MGGRLPVVTTISKWNIDIIRQGAIQDIITTTAWVKVAETHKQ